MVTKFCFAGARQLSVRSIIWWSLVHAIPSQAESAKTKSLTPIIALSHANPSGRSTLIRDGTQTDKQKTPNLGSIFPPNYDRCFDQQQGAQAPSQPNYATNHYII